MLAVRTRSGVVETLHDGAIAAIDHSGDLIARSGDIDTEFFLRSSAKPFQAFIAVENGADLSNLQLALACASHDGDPAHLAIVCRMLEEVGLGPDDLGCPPSWPLSRAGRDHLVRSGARQPRSLWHNCSGKHAAWLRACRASGWPTDSYLDPEHPLQVRIADFITDLGSYRVDPVGIDGCGAPVFRTSVRAMARMFHRLAVDPLFSPVLAAMHTYPALTSGVGNGDSTIATALHAVAKRGAAGCLGVAVRGQLGIGVKAWDGSDRAASAAAVKALAELVPLSGYQARVLEPIGRPEELGGGKPVGHLESTVELSRT